MSLYPGAENEQRIEPQRLHDWVKAIFVRCGMNDVDAFVVADSLVSADLRGIHSHGVLRVPEYAKKLLHDGVNPRGQPHVVKDNSAALVIEGDNSMGQVAASFAMRHAMERARIVNVAVAAVRGSNHCGAMCYYAMEALSEGMIGIAMTNALPTMAPWGGVDKIVGINPLAIAIPAGEEAPLVLDAAFSYSSHGKIRIFHQKGYSIPATWAFDEDGQPTTDASKALRGLLQPIGEYKGVAFAMMFGILSSMLSGAGYGTESGNMVDGAKPGHDGQLFLVLRVAAFEDIDTFKSRIDGAIRQVRESRKAAGVEKLYAPGGLEAEIEVIYRRDGIPLNAATFEGLRKLSDELGVLY